MLNAYSPNGDPIIGTLDSVPGICLSRVSMVGGTITIEPEGETQLDWNNQVTQINDANERLFVCEKNGIWAESQLVFKQN